MTRSEILDEVKRIVCGDRDEQYGTPEDNFSLIARFWDDYIWTKIEKHNMAFQDEIYKGYTLTAEDVAVMMCLFKIARVATGQHKLDNYVDLAGYATCAGEISERVRRPVQA